MIKAGLADPLISTKTNEWLHSNRERIKAVILPVGSIEQHSKHLPVGTDYLISFKLAIKIAWEAYRRNGVLVLVAPPLPYGLSIEWIDKNHENFVITLSAITFYNVVKDVINSLILYGFKNIIILNAHGGNENLLNTVANELLLSHRENIKIILLSWWNIVKDLISSRTHQKRMLHGGEVETSIALALNINVSKRYLCNTYNKLDKLPWEGDRGEIIFSDEVLDRVANAVIGDPEKARKELGVLLVNYIIDRAVELILRL